jgi:hypothetical protein
MIMRRLLSCLVLTAASVAFVSAQGVPVPRPFPGAPAPSSPRPATSQPPAVPATPAPTAPAPETPAAQPAAAEPAPTTDVSGVPVYPTADHLETIDAGAGQSYHLYGTDAPFSQIVAYYRNVLDDGGRTIYRTPAVHQFDLGRFDDNRMAFPPSVVVKDYSGGDAGGYLHVDGTNERRYATIIQIVPPATTRR